MLPVNWSNIGEVAQHVHEWANRTFPGRKPKAALTKLNMEEMPELLMHLKEKGPEGIGEELADCFILLLDLSVIWKVDLPRAIRDKMQTNEGRMWVKDQETGHYNHAVLTPEVDFSGADGRVQQAEQFGKGLKSDER